MIREDAVTINEIKIVPTGNAVIVKKVADVEASNIIYRVGQLDYIVAKIDYDGDKPRIGPKVSDEIRNRPSDYVLLYTAAGIPIEEDRLIVTESEIMMFLDPDYARERFESGR